ncbi:uncharacterized protein N0V89_005427 [Didymosphaeria variabile]|uniref:Proteophosphoglycan 5 n=1 Tax=Didymosphaeria variabile TaxID=1932322 RepID=A0A9W8XKR8_9PLEO|nr:uncharacterized protein N0V89_005427 [Didymosphaeria variabile]KAJ4353697.1 hypothetical protein N0V89_005427 [Didymosphaeria variabile]
MSSTHVAASPRAPRAHNASKHNGTASPNNNGGRGQRRNRGNRAHNGNYEIAHRGVSGNALQEPSLSESAVFSSEEVPMAVGPRQPKKHTRSQPSADRVVSPTGVYAASLTDTEVGPGHSAATPAKPQGAYAGPTFHASPAPSALPIPKFLSKSVPPKTHSGPPTPPPEEGSESGSSPSPSPSRGAPIPIPSRSHQNSPLDLLFKADRAEKARNVNCSPPLATFPSTVPTSGGRPQHMKHDSFGSLNAPFPIELEANNQSTHVPPPAANHRSVTAPSKIPQMEAFAQPKESDAIQDLMSRLSMSQNKPSSSTPPRTGSTDPALQHHSPSPFHDTRPSPFRSTSGPTTPAPSTQVQEDPKLFYGNQNLSSKFKAAKTDSAKRNSGLRTEITADSPIIPQGGFPPIALMNNDSRSMIGNALNGSDGRRRGSAPHIASIPPYRGVPNNQNIRSPNRRSYQAHSNHTHMKPNGNVNAAPTGSPATMQKSTTAMAFIPSSVRAKPPPTPPRKVESDNIALEQNLKRMLNLGSGDTNGFR